MICQTTNALWDTEKEPSEVTVADIGGDFKNPEKLGCKYLIPATGGVGPLTRAFLMDHLFLKTFIPTLFKVL